MCNTIKDKVALFNLVNEEMKKTVDEDIIEIMVIDKCWQLLETAAWNDGYFSFNNKLNRYTGDYSDEFKV